MSTFEGTGLPTVTVGEREYEIGPITIHQLKLALSLVVSITQSARASKAKRDAELLPQSIEIATQEAADFDTIEESKRIAIARRLGVDVNELNQAMFLQDAMNRAVYRLEMEAGVDGQIGILLDYLSAIDEHHIAAIATLIVSRYPHLRAAQDYISEHFDMVWFTEALYLFAESNNLVAITKNLQRLATAVSMQVTTPRSQAQTKSA